VLQLCEPAQRFAFEDGSIVVDDDVGWLHERQTPGLDGVSQLRLQQAQRAEFVAGDRDAAQAQLDAVLARVDAQQPRAWPVLAQAAWLAHRRGDERSRDARLQQLDERIAALAAATMDDAQVRDATASATLLAATLGSAPDEHRLQLLCAMPPALAEPTLRRLQERSAVPAAAFDELQRTAARRALLVAAAAAVRAAPAAHGARGIDGGDVLLWFPDDGGGRGDGALVPRAWLATMLGRGTTQQAPPGLPPIPDRGALTFGDAPGGEPVLAGVASIAPSPPQAPPWFARPTAVLAAGAALLLLFGASAWATVRALLRETAAMRARAEFLSGVTHELKTPVASLRLIADVLHDDDVPAARQREYFAMMAGECARLSALIDNVLDLGQLERGERAYDLRDGDAADVVREAVEAFAPLAAHAGMQLELREGAVTAPCRLDRSAIAQALLNLLENARKYARAGLRIDVDTAAQGGRFVARVRDRGPGIPDAERERVFERFRRGAAQADGSVAGVGLGLFLSRAIVEHHGGALRCRAPDDGAGCVFELSLPLSPSPEEKRT